MSIRKVHENLVANINKMHGETNFKRCNIIKNITDIFGGQLARYIKQEEQ